MIDRLCQVRIKGFRPFLEDTGPLSLDADVVLVYGPNGAGKTGLMSAIECALTGAVTHLECFENDYPRCLRNTEHEQKAELWLEYLDKEKKLHQHQIAIEPKGDRDQIVQILPVLSPQDAVLFSERCYLSQHRLSRLLEIYQTSPQGTEQHLVRFARELLGLDVLENLINGLYVVKDQRRLKNALPPLDSLQTQATILENRIKELEGDVRQRDHELQAAIAAVQQLSPNTPPEVLTDAHLQEQVERVSDEQAKTRLLDRRQILQQQRGQLEGSVGFLAAISQSDQELSKRLPTELQAVSLKVSELRKQLLDRFAAITHRLQTAGCSEPDTPDPADIDRRFRTVRAEVRRLISAVEDEIAQRKQAKSAIELGQNDLALINTQLQSLTVASGDLARTSKKRVELLQAAIDLRVDNACPVCSRDYSEVSPSGLSNHIKQELTKLGVTIAQIESQGRLRVSLESRRDAVLKQIASANQRLVDGAQKYPDPDGTMLILRDADTHLDKFAVYHTSFIQLLEEEASIRGRIRLAQVHDKQFETTFSSIRILAQELNIDLPTDIKLSALFQMVREKLDDQITALEAELARTTALVSTYSTAAKARKTLADAGRSVASAQNELLRIRTAERASAETRATARAVERAAQAVKARLIQDVFNDKLNALCQALYRRLVRVEAFDPNLSEPRAVRGAIKAGVQAMSRKRKTSIPFQELASVVSASNLNTAALSLFLSLNLIQNPKHRILLFDDPVQSMDDIHVVQLAALLRSLVRETNRQLVVAVHERAMFEYLALELGPTRAQDSLITLELSRELDGSNTTVKVDRKTWKGDGVSFGDAKVPSVAG